MSQMGLSVVSAKESFRYDINALRAWAVLAVVLYHFGVAGFSSGFSGVDVFFVISGYLMTGIVAAGLENKQFSIYQFYIARLKRIVPALAVLCLVLLVLGWFLLAPDDYETLAVHVRDSLLFVSNNTYRKESGYFDVISHEKWLLHTWSLSVEWRFYLLLPLMLWGAWLLKKSKWTLLSACFLTLLYSLLVCIHKTTVDSTKAFYLMQFRCWEMMAGGVVYFVSQWRVRQIVENVLYVASLCMIVAAAFVFSGESEWPGYLAILPVFGASLYLYAGKSSLRVNRLLPIVWMGERSYSIYLWHWPVVVLISYFQLPQMLLISLVGIVGSFVLAEVSYRLVEVPFRRGFGLKKIWNVILVLGVAVAVYGMAMLIIKTHGVPDRVDEAVSRLAAEKNNIAKKTGHDCRVGPGDYKFPITSCTYGRGQLSAVVIGDSHAAAIVTSVQSAAEKNGGSIELWSRAACPFIRGVTSKIDIGCNDYVNWAIAAIKEMPSDVPVVMIARSSLYVMGANEGVVGSKKPKPPVYFDKPYDEATPEFLSQYKSKALATICEVAAGRKFYWVKPIPEMKVSVPQVMARSKMMNTQVRVMLSMSEYGERHAFTMALMEDASRLCGIKILDPLPYLCQNGICYGDKDGWPLYFDDDHLSETGNKVLSPMFETVFKNR